MYSSPDVKYGAGFFPSEKLKKIARPSYGPVWVRMLDFLKFLRRKNYFAITGSLFISRSLTCAKLLRKIHLSIILEKGVGH